MDCVRLSSFIKSNVILTTKLLWVPFNIGTIRINLCFIKRNGTNWTQSNSICRDVIRWTEFDGTRKSNWQWIESSSWCQSSIAGSLQLFATVCVQEIPWETSFLFNAHNYIFLSFTMRISNITLRHTEVKRCKVKRRNVSAIWSAETNSRKKPIQLKEQQPIHVEDWPSLSFTTRKAHPFSSGLFFPLLFFKTLNC